MKCLYFWNKNQINLKKAFEESIKFFIPKIELIGYELRSVETSDYGTEEFKFLMMEKTDKIKNFINENKENNSEILISDIDIIVYKNFEYLLKLGDKHIMFQKENPNNHINTGFIYLRCCGEVLKLWEHVHNKIKSSNTFITEQKVIHDDIQNFKNLKFGLFEDSIWADSNWNKPKDIIIHHANLTCPTKKDSSLSLKVNKIKEQLKNHKHPIKDQILSCLNNHTLISESDQKLVIARFKENISWAEKIENKFVVQKGLHLPNKGREASSYIWYIINNYEELKEDILFCQGNYKDHKISVYDFFSHNDGKPNHPGLNIKKFADRIGINIPETLWFTAGAQFKVTPEQIKNKSKEWYQNLYKVIISEEFDKTAHILERLWKYIFQL